MDLLICIRSLPREIMDIIAEYYYSLEHKKKLYKTHEEFNKIIYIPCRNCQRLYTENIYYSVDYFIYNKFKFNTFWCDDYCFRNDKDVAAKEYYKNSITDYLLNYSILHKGEHYED